MCSWNISYNTMVAKNLKLSGTVRNSILRFLILKKHLDVVLKIKNICFEIRQVIFTYKTDYYYRKIGTYYIKLSNITVDYIMPRYKMQKWRYRIINPPK